MESDDLSLETTVPTDFSLSADEISDFQVEDKKSKISKQLFERKQLLHDLQVLKIELSQKGLIIDNLKADHIQKVEELEERLGETLHQKQILQARLESQLKIQQDDSRRRQEQIQKEVETILRRQQQLEETNERLQEKAGNIRRSLQDLELTDNQYFDLRAQDESTVALKDFVAMKIFEAVKPLQKENEEAKSRLKSCGEELHRVKTEFERCQENLLEEQRNLADMQIKHQKLTLAFADTKSQVHQGNYKVENYDRVKRERDDLEQEFTDLKTQHAYLEAAHLSAVKERDELSNQFSSASQSIGLLKQDKDFFAKQSSDSGSKLLYAEERIVQLNEQLDRAKQAREELYDKYVASRDAYKSEYESKLREELEQIRGRTNVEIDRLKTSTREMYERENRSLREARDMSLSERDRALSTEKDANDKYDTLMKEFRQLQLNSDNRIAEMQNEVKLKSFESERTQMVYEETVRNLKECQLENEKLQKKLEVLTKEYYSMQTSLERRVSESDTQLAEKKIKLETYEKLEQELDDVVMQAAEVENEDEAERVLFSYGYGANVPTTAKRRLQQSVHLARRVLQLERANTSLRKELERETNKIKELAEQLKSANTLLDQSQQPYHYLVESIRTRDAQISKQKQHITTLEDDFGRLEKEKKSLGKAKNQMALDMERLLNQKEEMSVMKEVMLNMSQRRRGTESARSTVRGTARSSSPRTPVKGSGRTAKPKKVTGKGTAIHEPRQRFESPTRENEENVHKPPPTQFTSQGIPPWYKKMKDKSKPHSHLRASTLPS